MNYARIYAEFIRDRLHKQPEKPEYFEVHHIKPRCFGGGNEPENLVRLTPEDHLFAHLLLAVIHGGPLWAACFLMYEKPSGRRVRSTRNLRSALGLARRKWGEFASSRDGLKGSENGNYNPTIHRWRHLDTGRLKEATLHDMWSAHGGKRASWTSALRPKSGKTSVNGWALDDGFPRRRSLKGKAHTFVNRDGRVFHGTQQEFSSHTGCSVASASRIVNKSDVSRCGWRLDSATDRDWHEIKQHSNDRPKTRGRIYLARKGECEIRGRMVDIAKELGVRTQRFCAAMYQIRQGICKGYMGWEISEIVNVDDGNEVFARGDATQVRS